MADERRTDRRTLQRMLELAAAEQATSNLSDEDYGYWTGVIDMARQALGEDIFTVEEIKTFKLTKLSTTPVAAGENNPGEQTHGL